MVPGRGGETHMSLTRLEDWLRRISEYGDDAAVDAARALLLTDERIPDELRYVLDDPDERSDAAEALLFLLGEGESLVAEAIRAEAGSPEPDDLESNPIAGVPVAEAVRAEAGTTAVSGVWCESAHDVAAAVRLEAGSVDVADAVAGALGVGIPLVHGALRWSAGAVDVANAVIGAGPPIGAAVRSEAGTIEVGGAVLAGLGVGVPPVAAAVREGAGTVDIVDAVTSLLLEEESDLPEGWLSGMLDRELPRDQHVGGAARIAASRVLGRDLTDFASTGSRLRAAVETEAETISIWDEVATSIGLADPEVVSGWDGVAVKTAVTVEAGEIDVVGAVMSRVRRSAVAPAADSTEPEAANGSYWLTAVVAIAATILIVFGFSMGVGPQSAPGAVAIGEAPEAGEPTGLVFAKADEIRVDDLNYADDATVQLIQEEGDDAATIIWVDEGKTL
jgi:hypothetical protein